MASVAELEAGVLKGELKVIYRKYKLSNAPTREEQLKILKNMLCQAHYIQ